MMNARNSCCKVKRVTSPVKSRCSTRRRKKKRENPTPLCRGLNEGATNVQVIKPGFFFSLSLPSVFRGEALIRRRFSTTRHARRVFPGKYEKSMAPFGALIKGNYVLRVA